MNKYVFLSVSAVVFLVFSMFVLSSSPDTLNTQVLGTQSAFTSLSPQQFNQELLNGDYMLLDIRTLEEYNAGHLTNARQIDYYQTQSFSQYLNTLDKNAKYLIYCRSGSRTSNALALMKQKGFTQVWDLSGGFNAWTAQGLPAEQ